MFVTESTVVGVAVVITTGVVVYKLGKEIIKAVKEEHDKDRDRDMSYNSDRRGKAVNH